MWVTADNDVLLSEPIFPCGFRGGPGLGVLTWGRNGIHPSVGGWLESEHEHVFSLVEELPLDTEPGPYLIFPLIMNC